MNFTDVHSLTYLLIINYCLEKLVHNDIIEYKQCSLLMQKYCYAGIFCTMQKHINLKSKNEETCIFVYLFLLYIWFSKNHNYLKYSFTKGYLTKIKCYLLMISDQFELTYLNHRIEQWDHHYLYAYSFYSQNNPFLPFINKPNSLEILLFSLWAQLTFIDFGRQHYYR